MKTSLSLILFVVGVISGRAQSLGPMAISAGAARLDNGSFVNIGQPWVGLMSGPNGKAVAAGLIPAILGSQPRPNHAPQLDAIPDQIVFQGRQMVLQAKSSDPDIGNALS